MDQQAIQAALEKFIAAHTGELGVGDTQQNKGECVGLVEVWLDTLGLPHIWGNAIDLLQNANLDFYEITLNDKYNVPPSGAVLVFGQPFGEYQKKDETTGNMVTYYEGHTGVVVTADVNSVTLFESNNPIGSAPRIVKHSYNSVKGWITFKKIITYNKPVEVTTQPQKDPSTSNLIKEYFKGLDTHGLDPTNLDSAKVVYDTWDEVANKNLFTRNTDIEIVDESTYKDYDTIKAQLNAFIIAGYKTPDDVTKAIQLEHEKFVNLSHDQIEVEKKNESLALTLAQDSRNNYTAMEEGIKVVQEKEALVKEKIEIAKALDVTKPTTTNIIDRIFFIQSLASKWRSKLEDDARRKEAAAVQFGQPKPQPSAATTAFMSLLKLIPESKQKGGAN